MRDDTRIETIGLELLDASRADLSPVCGALRTGRGLRLGASLEEAKRLHPAATSGDVEKDIVLLEDDADLCMSGRSPILRSIRIYWSRSERKVTFISVEGSRDSCEDYKASIEDVPPDKR